MIGCDHRPSPNPRISECVKCGRPMPQMRDRDLSLERELTQLAAKAAGLLDAGGIDDYANARALPGGVRPGLDFEREMREELADARNYACWAVEPLWAAHQAGDPDASKQVAKTLQALSAVVKAWHALSA